MFSDRRISTMASLSIRRPICCRARPAERDKTSVLFQNVAAVASEILNGTSKGILPPGVKKVTPVPSAFQDGTVMD